MRKLDKINRQILRLLQANGRITNAELAEKTGLSPASTLERVKKLERQGILKGYAALVDPVKVGRGTCAWVTISLASHHAIAVEGFQKAIAALEEVLECYHIAGEDDYLLKVLVADMPAYEHFIIHKLASIINVGKVRTNFVMSVVKQETAIPIVDT